MVPASRITRISDRGGSTAKTLWLLPGGVLFAQAAVILFRLPQEPVLDERFFFELSLQFKNAGIAGLLPLLKSYSMPQPPLAFLWGGFWLYLTGSLTVLRLLNAAWMSIANLAFLRLVDRCSDHRLSKPYVFAVVLTWFLNPYLQMVSVLFYTDAIYLACVILGVSACMDRRDRLAASGFLFAALVRQFGVLFSLGALFSRVCEKKVSRANLYLIAPVALVLLMLYWGGMSPSIDHNSRVLEVRETFGWAHWDYVSFYFSAIGLYLFPIMAWRVWGRSGDKVFLAGGGMAAVFAWVFPPAGNHHHVSVAALGIADSFLSSNVSLPIFHLILVLFAFLSGGWLAKILVMTWKRRMPGFMAAWILLFFLLHLFNSMAWEKYLLEILPVWILALLMLEGFSHDLLESSNRDPKWEPSGQ